MKRALLIRVRLLFERGIGQSLLSDSFWLFISTAAIRGLPFIGALLVAQSQGAVVLGIFAFLLTSLNALSFPFTYAIGLTAAKELSQAPNKADSNISSIITSIIAIAAIAGTLAALGFFLVARYWIATDHVKEIDVTTVLASSFLVLFVVLAASVGGILSGLRQFKALAKINVVSGGAAAALIVISVSASSLSGLFLSMAAGSCLATIWGMFYLRRTGTYDSMSQSRATLIYAVRRFGAFGGPKALVACMVVAVNWMCSFLLIRSDPSFVQMGYLGIAEQWFFIISLIPVVAAGALFPRMVAGSSTANLQDVWKMYRRVLRNVLLVTATIAVLVALASPWIVKLYGSSVSGARWTLVLLMGTTVMMAFQVPTSHFLSAFGKSWQVVVAHSVWSLICLSTAVILLQLEWGSLGVAMARTIAYCGQGLILFIFVRRLLNSNVSPIS